MDVTNAASRNGKKGVKKGEIRNCGSRLGKRWPTSTKEARGCLQTVYSKFIVSSRKYKHILWRGSLRLIMGRRRFPMHVFRDVCRAE